MEQREDGSRPRGDGRATVNDDVDDNDEEPFFQHDGSVQ